MLAFDPIGEIDSVAMARAAQPNLSPKDLSELVVHLKEQAKAIKIGNAGVGSGSHVCGLLFMRSTTKRRHWKGRRRPHDGGRRFAAQTAGALGLDATLRIADRWCTAPPLAYRCIRLDGTPQQRFPRQACPAWRRAEPSNSCPAGGPTHRAATIDLVVVRHPE